jgi:hypothetical protein
LSLSLSALLSLAAHADELIAATAQAIMTRVAMLASFEHIASALFDFRFASVDKLPAGTPLRSHLCHVSIGSVQR